MDFSPRKLHAGVLEHAEKNKKKKEDKEKRKERNTEEAKNGVPIFVKIRTTIYMFLINVWVLCFPINCCSGALNEDHKRLILLFLFVLI